ncbi:MAG: S8 family serine peptidase, partial [Bdellovibrionales bacterium]|nr:S8 family serine peptidase [Bdellovibrionales bacterium]
LTELLNSIIATNAVEELPLINAVHVKAQNGTEIDVDTTLDLLELAAMKNIAPDHTLTIDRTPNDSSFSSLWGMHNSKDYDIDAPEAWDDFVGNPDDPVVVAVIDTGVDYNHADLRDNMWVNEAEKNGTPGVDDDGNGVVDDIHGYNSINNSGDPLDDQKYCSSGGQLYTCNVYHGTHCAGTIGAVADNNLGVAGVAWDVKIMGIKFLNHYGSGSTSNAIKSVQYAVTMRNRGVNVRVLSNSWGGGGYSYALADAISAANNAGISFIAAAGNASTNTDSYTYYPQGYNISNVVSVAALDSSGKLASFSNYGATSVDLGAPGVSIFSTKGGGSNSYQYLSGTSMATPHVSGVAAMAFMGDPTLSPADVRQLLINTIQPISTLNGKMIGAGMLNLKNVTDVTAFHLPTIEPIADKQIQKNQPTSVSIVSSDQDGDAITLSAALQVPEHRVEAAALDEMWNFTGYVADKDNAIGLNERHLVSPALEFIIFSDGEVYRSDPTYLWLRSGSVDPLYYVHPEKLIAAYPASPDDFATLNLVPAGDGLATLTITPATDATGTFQITVSASDGRGTTNESFSLEILDVQNAAPDVLPFEDETTSWALPLRVPVSVTDSDHSVSELVITAVAVGSEGMAYELDRIYNLRTNPFRADNALGLNEKHFQSITTGDQFYIVPSGEFYTIGGTLVEKLDPAYWAESGKMIDVPAPTSGYPDLVKIRNRELWIDGRAQYFGRFRIDVTATDPLGAKDTERLWVTLNNAAPVLAAIGNQDFTREEASRQLVLSAVDENDDFLTFTAELLSETDPGNMVSLSGNTLTIALADGFFGSFDVRVTVTDGALSDSETFTVTVANTAPTISQLDDLVRHWKAVPLTLPVSIVDPDGDPLDINVSVESTSGAEFSGTATYAHGALVYAPQSGYLGTARIRIQATDGLLTSTEELTISVTNATPAISAIPDQDVPKRDSSRTVSFTATDTDGDSLSVTARLLPPGSSGPAIVVGAGQLTLQFAQGQSGTYTVEVTADDGIQHATRTFSVVRKNKTPVLEPIQNVTTHWKANVLHVPLAFSDEDNDSLSVTVASNGFPGSATVQGSTLTIQPASNTFVGVGTFTVTVSDGTDSAAHTFQGSFTNQAPSLPELPNREESKSVGTLYIPLNAADADGDALTLTAAASNGATATVQNGTLHVSVPDQFVGATTVTVSAS